MERPVTERFAVCALMLTHKGTNRKKTFPRESALDSNMRFIFIEVRKKRRKKICDAILISKISRCYFLCYYCCVREAYFSLF